MESGGRERLRRACVPLKVRRSGAERALDSAMLRAMITSTSWGIGWLVGAAGVLVTAVGLFIARRNNAGYCNDCE